MSVPTWAVGVRLFCVDSRDDHFLEISNGLLANHNNAQLNGQFKEAAIAWALVLAYPEQRVVRSRSTRELALQKVSNKLLFITLLPSHLEKSNIKD